jgi:[methyl-Co(III) methanol-specific corrinoid protein]:coenzyme M methyltransferase
MTVREQVLALLAGDPPGRLLVFGGLPSLTRTGLEAADLAFAEVHRDADGMARAAASTAAAFGYGSAVVPHDMCVEAEALGAGIDFREGEGGFGPPLVARPLGLDEVPSLLREPAGVSEAGRVPLVCEAIRELRRHREGTAAVGAWVPGPFTLGWQLYGMEGWMELVVEPERLALRLALLAVVLARVAAAYRAAGADFLTIHEMGGSPQVIGPRAFRRQVVPALQRLIGLLPAPVVLSVCGDTNAVIGELAACGAAALNVDHRNDLARTRSILGPGPLLFGNLDPVGVLAQGTPEHVAETVGAIAAAGADALWPGCDLWPDIPEANFRALMEAAARCRPLRRG